MIRERHRLGWLRRSRKGLTIIEIILSIAIIAISAIVLIRVFLSAASLNDRARAHTQAVMSVISVLDLVGDEEYERLLEGGERQVFEHLSLTPSDVHSGYRVESFEGKDLFKLMVRFDLHSALSESQGAEQVGADTMPYLLVNATAYDKNGVEIYGAEKKLYYKWGHRSTKGEAR